jgi:hypothetical protein
MTYEEEKIYMIDTPGYPRWYQINDPRRLRRGIITSIYIFAHANILRRKRRGLQP